MCRYYIHLYTIIESLTIDHFHLAYILPQYSIYGLFATSGICILKSPLMFVLGLTDSKNLLKTLDQKTPCLQAFE